MTVLLSPCNGGQYVLCMIVRYCTITQHMLQTYFSVIIIAVSCCRAQFGPEYEAFVEQTMTLRRVFLGRTV